MSLETLGSSLEVPGLNRLWVCGGNSRNVGGWEADLMPSIIIQVEGKHAVRTALMDAPRIAHG